MSEKKLLDFSTRAIRDVAGIEAFIATDSPSAAVKVVAAIYRAAERLEYNPLLGRDGSNPGTRELIIPKYPYTLIYRLTPTRIHILTVLHQKMKYPS